VTKHLSDEEDPEPFCLARRHANGVDMSAMRNTAMLARLEQRLRASGKRDGAVWRSYDDGEIEDRLMAAADRWDRICMRRERAWNAWQKRRARYRAWRKAQEFSRSRLGRRLADVKLARMLRRCERERSRLAA